MHACAGVLVLNPGILVVLLNDPVMLNACDKLSDLFRRSKVTSTPEVVPFPDLFPGPVCKDDSTL